MNTAMSPRSTLALALTLAALTASGAAAAKGAANHGFQTLYTFTGGNDGGFPLGNLISDADGNLYGTSVLGGTSGNGAVFKLAPDGTQTVLYSFTGGADGAQPYSGLVRDKVGNLYGTTYMGGTSGLGAVYKLAPDGTETVLMSFDGSNGSLPANTLTLDRKGNIYGVASAGGAFGYGTVFTISSAGKTNVLYSFTGGADGNTPYSSLVRDTAGNLYGTTLYGGATKGGTVFKVTKTGTESVLYSFVLQDGTTDGFFPQSGLIQDKTGNFYGTTTSGGSGSMGTVFKLTPDGTETVLYRFTGVGNGDGAAPTSGLIMNRAGNLFGTTSHGGSVGVDGDSSGNGTVFELMPDGKEKVLYRFTGGADGAYSNAGLIDIRPDGLPDIYGTTILGGADGIGTIFRLKK